MRGRAPKECPRSLQCRQHSFFKLDVRRRRGCAAARAAPSDVFVLDLDGVLVDSEPEVSEAGIRGAFEYWPSAFHSTQLSNVIAKQRDDMRMLRSQLVEGYETMIMARLLQEGTSAAELAQQWPDQLSKSFGRFDATREELDAWFEHFRSRWMQEKPEQYLAANKVYAGVETALQYCDQPFYIASSKKANRVSKLATDLLKLKGFEQDSPRMFAALLPPNERKAQALQEIASRPMCKDDATTLHFVDDRANTLLHIAQQPELQRWKLYFADWGYSSSADESSIQAQDRVRSLSLSQFSELLKWGVTMGVDDGCEPEPHEVQASIAQINQRK